MNNLVKVYGLDGKAVGDVELPQVFSTPYRPDVIQRAVLALQSQRRQPYGSDILAGKRSSAHYHGRRHIDNRQTMMNREMARMPRIHGKSAGWQAWRPRIVPQARGGREAHPPRVEKVWAQKINRKEYELAIRSAIAASAKPELLLLRHNEDVVKKLGSPIIFVDDLENVRKTKEIKSIVSALGLSPEIRRCLKRKIRAGRGKLRGRKYKQKKGLLFIFPEECPGLRACKAIAGADSVSLASLNVEILAPGAQAGRIIITTRKTLGLLDEIFVTGNKK